MVARWAADGERFEADGLERGARRQERALVGRLRADGVGSSQVGPEMSRMRSM